MKQKGSILALDWGKKYIGCAYALQDSTIVFPIGYLLNDKTLISGLADIVSRYRVKHIVIGIPRDGRAKSQIQQFAGHIEQVTTSDMTIELFDEDYTSVQAGERLGNFQKNVGEDTIAAMLILERWIANRPTTTV